MVTGANGQLGYDVMRHLNFEGIECLGTDREVLDITNEEHVKKVISNYNPDVVIHCAAYTAVDKAEDEREQCYSVNVLGTKYVAEACRETNAKMVYISTDYVFNGEGDQPFTVSNKPNPINYYGQTKYEGELEVQKLLEKFFIVRVSWVFGSNGNNFVKTMLRLGKELHEISVVSDQIGSPTYTFDLTKLLYELIQTEKFGVYHASNEGYCSWNEFACEIFRQASLDVKVNPINTEDYPTRAKRPKNSRLDKTKNISSNLTTLRTWQDALKMMINNEMR
jgi:dTDP-4-dehydrorhamnose reductase